MNVKYLFTGALFLQSCTALSLAFGERDCQDFCTKDGNLVQCKDNELVFFDCALGDEETCDPETFTCGECGDGELSAGEECDDDNTTPNDGCDERCQLEGNVVCGNTIVEFNEECDDGNNQNGDTCENDCTLPVCGNLITDPSLEETCDDGNQANNDGCSEDCKLEFADCGNNVVEAGESCDDGNNINGDACENDCSLPVCGNAIVDQGEQCDFGDTNNNDGCSDSCLDEVCSDGIVQSNEQCDDGNQVNTDACDNLCQVSAACGDNNVDAGEQCDDGNNTDGDGCSAACLNENCGDSIIQGAEQCDDGAANSDLFADACRENCRNARCGDGIVDFNEECDNSNPNCTNCQVTISDEFETNNSLNEADTVFNANNNLRITSETHIRGVRQGTDIFRVEFAQLTSVRIEIFDGSGADCVNAGNPGLSLFDFDGFFIKGNNNSGINDCGAIVTRLQGIFYVELDKNGGNLNDYNYILEIVPLASINSEIEPNNSLGAAADEITGPDVFVLGDYPVVSDVDFYQIEIPTNGLSVRAQTFEGNSGERCEDNEIDSEIALFDVNGVLLDVNDDDEDFCAILDGTGGNPKNPGASNLPAGTYFIRVDSSPAAFPEGEIFDYRLAVTIR